MSDRIINPASRITGSDGEKLTAALLERYKIQHALTGINPIVLTHHDIAGRFAMACDATYQLLWPEGTGPDDPLTHTSDGARAIARVMFAAIGLTNSDQQAPAARLHPETITFTSAELTVLGDVLGRAKEGIYGTLEAFTSEPEYDSALKKIEAAQLASYSDDSAPL